MKCVSLFAGIGGFDLGFQRAGIDTVAVVERDESCRKLLGSKFPHAQIFDDVRTVGATNLPKCDILAGGFPCQGLSIAGKRLGLADERSGLFYQLARITDELRPTFLVWENVPGLLSSNDGRDFLAVLIELDRIGYHGAWRMFDAQHFGVAQRRRRIFGVFTHLDSGAARCAEILSLAEGLLWHPAPSRQPREKVAGTLTRSSLGSGSPSGRDGREGCLVTGTLHGRLNSQKSDHASAGFIIPDVANCLEAQRGQRNNPAHETWVPVAFSSKDHGADATRDLSPTLRACGHKESHANGGGPVAIAFDTTQITHPENRSNPQPGDPCHPLASAGHAPTIAFNARQDPDNWEERTGPLDTDGSTQAIAHDGVRRLTPTECERLQGFPDGWTAEFSDSTRYKMLGNAVAVPCAEWLGKRINR